MSGSGPLVVGIDVAASRPSVAAALRAGRGGSSSSAGAKPKRANPETIGAFSTGSPDSNPAAVAVAAAQRPRRGRAAAPGPPRHADTELLRRRIAVTPAPTRAQAEGGAARYGRVRVGLAYFKDLRRLGYEPLAPGALAGALGRSAALLEVYPHGSFVALLGGTPHRGLRGKACTLACRCCALLACVGTSTTTPPRSTR